MTRSRTVTRMLRTVACLGLLSAGAWAEDAPKPAVADSKSSDAKPAPSSVPNASQNAQRRDPKGKKGIGPFMEAMHRGDDAAVARDYPKAKEAYQAALAIQAKQPMAHYRIGQVEALAGKLSDAETAYNDALRFADDDPTLHATLLFALADLKERQGQRDAAIKAWQAYADYLTHEPRAKGYPASATERKQRLIRYSEMVVESKAVKDRIELRLKELDESAKRNAAKNKGS